MTHLACGQPDWNHSAELCRQGCSEWPAIAKFAFGHQDLSVAGLPISEDDGEKE